MPDSLILEVLQHYFPDSRCISHEVMSYGKENTSVSLVLDNGQSVLMRIWGSEHSHIGVRRLDDIKAELAFMVHCHDAGLPVPEVYASMHGEHFAALSDGSYCMVMGFVPGSSPRNVTADMLRQIAELMARLHRLSERFSFPTPRAWPGTIVDMTNQRLAKLDVVLGDLDSAMLRELTPLRTAYDAALRKLDLAVLPRGPIHGDIMWENVKFEAGHLSGLFDFDDCRDSYFLEDIVKTLLFEFDDVEHSFLDAEGAYFAQFLDAYQALRPLTPEEQAALSFFMTAGYLYRFTAYVGKWAKGDESYRARLKALQTRYQRHADLFLSID
jgi:Ser/Thr protein kinase RdoA (MazF antagonist)